MSEIETVGIPCDEDITLSYGQRTIEIGILRDYIKQTNTKLQWGFGLKHHRLTTKLSTIVKELSLSSWSLEEKPSVAHSYYGPRWLLVSRQNGHFMLFKYISATFIPVMPKRDNKGTPFNNIQCNYALVPMDAIIKDGSYVSGYSHDNILQSYSHVNNRGFNVGTFAIRASTIKKQIEITNRYDFRNPSIPMNMEDICDKDIGGIAIWGFDFRPTLTKAVSKQRTRWLIAFREANIAKFAERRIADAAIMGSYLEFICSIKPYMRNPDWRTRKIMPSSRLLTTEQRLAGPQSLYYWLRPDVCHKCMGERAYGDILEIVMRGSIKYPVVTKYM